MSHDMMAIVTNSSESIAGTSEMVGQHICSIYRDRIEQFSLVAGFMLDGLRKGHQCIYIIDENTKDGVLSVLKEKEDDIDEQLLDDLIFLTKEESYLEGGSFDPDRMIRLLEETQEKALAGGHPAFRVTGEMTWIFSKLPGVERLLEYEAKLNYFFPSSRSSAICQYHEDRFDAMTLMGVLNTHPIVGIYGKLYENPYYIPPDAYLASLGGSVPVALYEKAREDVMKRAYQERARRSAELTLRETNKKLTLLSSMTSHDMSNQLSVIMGCNSLVMERNTDPELKTLIETINNASEKMKAQIDFTRMYQELGTTEPQWVGIRSILSSATKSQNLGDISIGIDVPDVEVLADPMLEMVFYNLIDNSVRHGGRVRSIRVSSAYTADGLRIVYEDDGTGVRAEDKDRIFERGFGKNTGLGLFLSRDILALTGVSIRETGKAGGGARFEIAVPPSRWRPARSRGASTIYGDAG